MSEFLIGIIGIILIYFLGLFLYPETQYKSIQQELIKMEDE